jgi:hypothetical protein
MTIYNDAEVTSMLSDWGNVLTAGGFTAPCFLDDSEQLELEFAGGAGQKVRRITATIRTSDCPDLKANDPISVDGLDYIVWDRTKLGDGALTELTLRISESES